MPLLNSTSSYPIFAENELSYSRGRAVWCFSEGLWNHAVLGCSPAFLPAYCVSLAHWVTSLNLSLPICEMEIMMLLPLLAVKRN